VAGRDLKRVLGVGDGAVDVLVRQRAQPVALVQEREPVPADRGFRIEARELLEREPSEVVEARIKVAVTKRVERRRVPRFELGGFFEQADGRAALAEGAVSEARASLLDERACPGLARFGGG
jgi:transcriptional regulator GlxA family with amidase domain